MRFKHVMLVGIALLAFTAAPASAQWFVTPYAGGSFGGDAPNTKADVGAGIGWLGGGFMAQFNDHVGWRTDVRYFRALNTKDSTNNFDLAFGNFDFWRATGGLTFSF